MTAPRQPSGRLGILDVLRFAAALMVVCFHWFFNGIANGKVPNLEFSPLAPFVVYGFLGVHLFFIISGYVISESANGKSASRFAVGRAVRLYPAFWAGMALTTAVAVFWGGKELGVTVPQFLANLTMMPQLLNQNPVDGVYWTLFIELTFYALVFVVLLCRLGKWLDGFFPVWAILMLAVSFTPGSWSELPFLGGYYVFFALGATMAVIRRRGWTVLRVVGLAAGAAGSLSFVASNVPQLVVDSGFEYRSEIAVAIVVGFLLLVATIWIPRVRVIRIPLSKTMSDLTYPVYLIHAHIGYMVLAHVATPENVLLLYPSMFIGLCVAAWVLHDLVEVRLGNMWFRAFSAVIGRPLAWFERVTRPRAAASRTQPAPPRSADAALLSDS